MPLEPHPDDLAEPMLKENPSRFVIFPIQFKDLWLMYKKAQASFWTAEEIDLANDLRDWDGLTADEQFFIKHVLAFFAASDGIVNENLVERFCGEVQIPEARFFYGFQIAIENIHSETYSLLIDTYVKDKEEKAHLFNALETVPCVQKKANWALRWITESSRFAERLVAFATFEGVLFASSFAAIYHFKQRGVMPGLCFSNELISRDESMHADFATLLYTRHVRHKLSDERVHAIVGDAVEAEEQFVRESLHADIVGLSADKMVRYVHHVANRLLVAMGHPALYDDAASLPYMDNISIDSSGNFFETRINQYAKRSATAGDIELDSEF